MNLAVKKLSLLYSNYVHDVLNFLETLENDDDVQYVYANIEINSNLQEKI